MDRTKVVIQFRQTIWTCPKCLTEDIAAASMDGGNVYEHDCSKCGTHFNGPIGRPGRLDYTGTVSLTPEEYAIAKDADITTRKRQRVNEWIDSIKNPPKAVEPTAADLEAEQAELIKRIEELEPRIKTCSDYKPPTPEQIKAKRDKLVADLDSLDLEIQKREELPMYVADVEAEVERLKEKAAVVESVAEKIRGQK